MSTRAARHLRRGITLARLAQAWLTETGVLTPHPSAPVLVRRAYWTTRAKAV